MKSYCGVILIEAKFKKAETTFFNYSVVWKITVIMWGEDGRWWNVKGERAETLYLQKCNLENKNDLKKKKMKNLLEMTRASQKWQTKQF